MSVACDPHLFHAEGASPRGPFSTRPARLRCPPAARPILPFITLSATPVPSIHGDALLLGEYFGYSDPHGLFESCKSRVYSDHGWLVERHEARCEVGPQHGRSAVCAATPFVFNLLDSYNNPTTTPNALTFPLTVTIGGFYSAMGCTGSAVSNVVIGQGDGTATLYYKSPSAGTANVSVTGNSMPALNFSFSVTAGGLVGVSLTSATPGLSVNSPGQGIAGQCLKFQVGYLDAGGNAVSSANAISVTLTQLNSTVRAGYFYADNVCKTSIGSIAIPVQTPTATVFYKAMGNGSVTLQASLPGLSVGQYQLNLSAGPATMLGISGPSWVVAGACSSPYSVVAFDANGNQTAMPGITLSFSGAGSGGIYSDAITCQTSLTSVRTAAPYLNTQFFLSDPKAEGLTLQVSSSNPAIATAFYPVLINPQVASKLRFTLPPPPIVNTCSGQVTFIVVDPYGNPTSPMSKELDFAIVQSGNLSFMDSDCDSPLNKATILANQGTSQPFTYKSSMAQNSNVTFTEQPPGAIPIVGNASLVVNPVPNNGSTPTFPVYRLYYPGNGDNMVSQDPKEATGAPGESNLGYVSEGFAFNLYSVSTNLCNISVRRCLDRTTGHHFVSTSGTCAVSNHVIQDESGSVAGFGCATQVANTSPFNACLFTLACPGQVVYVP